MVRFQIPDPTMNPKEFIEWMVCVCEDLVVCILSE